MKLLALGLLMLLPAVASSHKTDQRARESYRKELRNQRHAAALEQSREHRNRARELNRERKAYAKDLRRGHRK
ncbi:MAG: hypothetical protein M3O35_06185 [Acidobacteriota bacterium]|nr:hypothetical protein [Acidobacteriota bacterium]